MWTDGQQISRDEVEPALAAAYPLLSHFLAHVTESDALSRQTNEPYISVRIELTDMNNRPLPFANRERAVYYSAKAYPNTLPQVEGFAA